MAQTPHLEEWFEEVWHKGNEEAIERLMQPDAVIHGLGTEKDKFGHEAFKPFYKNFRESFPVVHVELQPIFGNDEFEAADCVVTAENNEGKKAEFPGITIIRLKDGKLAEGWNGYDFLTMYRQLGFQLTQEK